MKVKVGLVHNSLLFFDKDGAEFLCKFSLTIFLVITNNYRQ